MNKYTEQLQQIEKRIAELQSKAEWVRAQIEPKTEDAPVVIKRRGRRKLNETV